MTIKQARKIAARLDDVQWQTATLRAALYRLETEAGPDGVASPADRERADKIAARLDEIGA